MRIAIFGDVHDRFENLERVLTAIEKESPEATICLGDLTSTEVLAQAANALPNVPIHVIVGNNDDAAEIKSFIDKKSLDTLHWHGLTGTLTADTRRIAFTHQPHDAEGLLQEDFDVICYGHTHKPLLLSKERALLVNPGDVQGRFGGSPGYAVYDTVTGEAELKKV